MKHILIGQWRKSTAKPLVQNLEFEVNLYLFKELDKKKKKIKQLKKENKELIDRICDHV